MKTYIIFSFIVLVLVLAGCKGDSSSGEPVYTPTPEPAPAPAPEPVYEPEPEPVYEPEPVPLPEPVPTPVPEVEDWAKLTWVAPLTRVNGESISMGELDGYIINYGTDPEVMGTDVQILGGNVMERTIEDLTEGVWYFNIQTRDTNGLVSQPSATVTKTIE